MLEVDVKRLLGLKRLHSPVKRCLTGNPMSRGVEFKSFFSLSVSLKGALCLRVRGVAHARSASVLALVLLPTLFKFAASIFLAGPYRFLTETCCALHFSIFLDGNIGTRCSHRSSGGIRCSLPSW